MLEPTESNSTGQEEGTSNTTASDRISETVQEYTRIAQVQIQRVSELTESVNKLCTNVLALDENVKTLGFISGIQTIRLENLLNMSIPDIIRLLLPRFLGGLRMVDVANKRLVRAQLDRLDWASRTAEAYARSVLNGR